jgi:methylenetetrahydrofolate reductase (NADPH)
MVATAKRLSREGYPVMPHFPARIIRDRATLADWIARYQGEAGVEQALLLAGGVATPHGDFHSSMQLLESGEFGKAGFKRLHVAGHPEGNRDIDPDGGMKNVEDALHWKQKFSETTDAEMALATQFAFEFAIACGVGPSLKVLQKRAMDVSKLLLPYEPTEVLTALAAHKADTPESLIERVHFFPLGGIKANAQWAIDNGGSSGVPASKQG